MSDYHNNIPQEDQGNKAITTPLGTQSVCIFANSKRKDGLFTMFLFVFMVTKFYKFSILNKFTSTCISVSIIKQEGHEALNRSPEYTGQSQTFNFEI